MKSAFPNITKINYEGANSKNPLAFKHYNPDEIVAGKSMREHLRFAVVYWHTFRGTGSDPFGAGTMHIIAGMTATLRPKARRLPSRTRILTPSPRF